MRLYSKDSDYFQTLGIWLYIAGIQFCNERKNHAMDGKTVQGLNALFCRQLTCI